MTFWHYRRGETNPAHVTHKRRTLSQNVVCLQRKFSSVGESTFSSAVRVMKRLLSPRKLKNGERDRCEFGSQSLHQPRGCRSGTPGNTRAHLERIVNGIDVVPRVIKNESPCRDINTNDLRHDAFAQIRFHPLGICVFLTLCTQLEQSRTLQILPRIVRTQCLERQFKGVLISEFKKKKKQMVTRYCFPIEI